MRAPSQDDERRRLLEAGRRQLARFKTLAAIRREDEAILERLLGQATPDLHGIIDVARLLRRYSPSEDPEDAGGIMHRRLQRVMHQWGVDESKVNDEARKAWQSGYRPNVGPLEVGSGAM